MKKPNFQAQCLILGLICLLVVYAPAYSGQSKGILTVRKITFEGLKRTRTSAVKHIVNVKEGDPWTDETRDLMERRLNNYGTFQNIILKENVDGDFVDPRFFVLYSDPHFLSWDWELTLIGGYRDDIITDFEEEVVSAGALVRYRFDDFVSFGGSYRYNNVKHKGGELTPVDGKSHSLSLDFLYNRLYYDEDYVDGISLGLSLQRELWFSDFDYTIAGLNVSLYKKAFFHHTLALQNVLSMSWNAPYGYTFILGGKGGRGTLPVKGYDDNEFLADQVLSGTLEYRIPFFTSRAFILSAVAFFDYAFFSEQLDRLFSSEFIHSYGISVRLYLRRLALPAFQLYAAYVPDKGSYDIGLMIGMSFR